MSAMGNHVSGMDTEQARDTSRQMDSNAAVVGDMVSGLSAVLAGLNWTGGDAQRFKSDWDSTFAPQANGAIASIQEQAQVLRAHADRQDQASS